MLAWPTGSRADLAREACDAALRGFRRRRDEQGIGAAWIYLIVACADLVRSGMVERRRRRVRAPERRFLSGFDHDLRWALRRLRRDTGFAAIAGLLIALGVGANAAAFGAVKAVLLSSPPLPGAASLGLVQTRTGSPQGAAFGGWSYPEVRDLRDATRELFSGLAAYTLRRATIVEPGDPEHLGYELITPGYFATLGLRPAAGRFFVAEEEGVDAAPDVAVISHRLWRRRFGGDPAAVGAALRLEGSRLTIVGVAPAGFDGLTGDARLWVPVGQSRPNLGNWGMQRRDIPWLSVIARRAAAQNSTAVAERLAAIGTSITAGAPRGEGTGQSVAIFSPLVEVWIPDATRSALHLAMGAAFAVLLIVTVNLAALILLAERRRARATAMRLALGAGRWQIVRSRLVEAILLTLAGGGLGLLVAHASIGGLARLWPAYAFRGSAGLLQLVDIADITIDGTIVAAGIALAMLTTLLATAVPAVLGTRREVVISLKQGASLQGDRRRRGVQNWLLGGQIALATVLLSTFGLLAGTILSLRAQQRGFDANGLLILSYSFVGRPAMALQEASRAFHDRLRERLAAIPGVASVSMTTSAPLASGFVTSRLRQVDDRIFPEGSGPELGAHMVDHRYFGTLGSRIERGRAFTVEEARAPQPVAVISRAAAAAFFAGSDPIGRRMRFSFPFVDPDVELTVIGVVEDILFRSPVEGLRPEVFVPLGYWAPPGLTALVRTAVPPRDAISAAREALAAVDPDVAYSSIRTGDELRAEDIVTERAVAIFVGLFAVLALFLSMAGLWATVARAVAERRREIGVRMAIGGGVGAIRRLFVRQRLVPVIVGGTIGSGAATLVARRMDGLLFGVSSSQPWLLAGTAVALVTVSLLATWLPARAITRIDPIEALAEE